MRRSTKREKCEHVGKKEGIDFPVAKFLFTLFLIWLVIIAVTMKYDYDWWYYAKTGGLGEWHDLALVVSKALIHIGNFALPMFFTLAFIGSAYYMLRKMTKYPWFIFLLAPISLSFLYMFRNYFIYAQMLATSFFMLAVGLNLRDHKWLPLAMLGLSFASHVWSGVFFVLIYLIYLLTTNPYWRRFSIGSSQRIITIEIIWVCIFSILVAWCVVSASKNGFIGSLSDIKSGPADFVFILTTQAPDVPIIYALAAFGLWRLRTHRLFPLFLAWVIVPTTILLLSWAYLWSYRVWYFVPVLPLSTVGCSALFEWLIKKWR